MTTKLTLGDGTGGANAIFDGGDGFSKALRFQTDGSNRWQLRSDNTSEVGSNAGSNFQVIRRDDNAGNLGTALTIKRDTGFIGINGVTSPSAALSVGIGAIEIEEMTAPGAGVTNTVRVYAEDNGAGKTRLMAQFGTGAAVQIAIEP